MEGRPAASGGSRERPAGGIGSGEGQRKRDERFCVGSDGLGQPHLTDARRPAQISAGPPAPITVQLVFAGAFNPLLGVGCFRCNRVSYYRLDRSRHVNS